MIYLDLSILIGDPPGLHDLASNRMSFLQLEILNNTQGFSLKVPTRGVPRTTFLSPFRLLGPRCPPAHPQLVPGDSILVSGDSILVSGDSILVSGDSILALREWILVPGDSILLSGDSILNDLGWNR